MEKTTRYGTISRAATKPGCCWEGTNPVTNFLNKGTVHTK
jgi:hypothetical protein